MTETHSHHAGNPVPSTKASLAVHMTLQHNWPHSHAITHLHRDLWQLHREEHEGREPYFPSEP